MLVKLIKYRLKATIMEPMVALMIILFSLTSAFTIVLKTNNHDNIRQISRAESTAESILNQTIHEGKFLDEETKTEGFRIEKSMEWYDKPNHLLKIRINIYDNQNKLLTIRQRVIICQETNGS